MNCLICDGSMVFFLSKPFWAHGLEVVDYWRCMGCGFVVSKTHVEMAPDTWAKVNYEYHASYQGKESDPGDPNWIARLQNQSRMINDVEEIGLLNRDDRWLDYGCGDGKLSALLQSEYNLRLLKYERYMPRSEDYLDSRELLPNTFDFVISTSVFEHFARREQFNAVHELVSERGVLGLHTLVCEAVPLDPTWYYMLPVHSAFHTNKSMEILFHQWGYTCSVYNVDAQLWLWFRRDPEDVENIIQRANARSNKPYYVFKAGFVDYLRVPKSSYECFMPPGGFLRSWISQAWTG